MASTIRIGNLFLPEEERFEGKDLPRFISAFSLLLSTLGFEYLIDPDAPRPPDAEGSTTAAIAAANEHRQLAHDRTLYKVLLANVKGDPVSIVREKVSGAEAYAHLIAFYGRKDVGTTVAMFRQYMNLNWLGGDVESFEAWITSKSHLRQDLISRGLTISDNEYALHILAAVPQAFVPMNGQVDFQDLSKLKSPDLVAAVQSTISISNMQSPHALYVGTTGNKDTSSNAKPNRPYIECGHCKSLGHTGGRIFHLEKDCRTKARNKTPLPAAPNVSAVAMSPINEICYISWADWENVALINQSKDTWVVDTGCTTSITPDASILFDYHLVTGQDVTFGNNHRLAVKGVGSYSFDARDGTIITIKRVLHVPGALGNLLSVRNFTSVDCNFNIQSGSNLFHIARNDGKIIAEGSLYNNLYICNLSGDDSDMLA